MGMNSIGTLIGNSEEENAIEKENSFSIMSYNVRLFNAYNWIKKEGVKNEIFDFSIFRKFSDFFRFMISKYFPFSNEII